MQVALPTQAGTYVTVSGGVEGRTPVSRISYLPLKGQPFRKRPRPYFAPPFSQISCRSSLFNDHRRDKPLRPTI